MSDTRTCDGCGRVEDAGTWPDQDGMGRSECCWREDAAWWTDPGGDSWVADLERDGRVITVRCLGVMKVVNERTGSVVRYAIDLEEYGFTKDADLESIGADGSAWEWDNNSWFELFEDDRSIGAIAHTFSDAIELAKRELEEVAA